MLNEGVLWLLAALLTSSGLIVVLPWSIEWLAEWSIRRGTRSRIAILGPLFWWELTRLVRRVSLWQLRVGYAVVLFLCLSVAYFQTIPSSQLDDIFSGNSQSVDPGVASRFANQFFQSFMMTQLVGLLLLVPIYFGGDFINERNMKTLELLRFSMLTSREIVMGKFLARTMVILSLIAAGIPILSLSMLFGGVDLAQLLILTIVAVSSSVSLAALSLFLSMHFESLRPVMLICYAYSMSMICASCCFSQNKGVLSLLSPLWFTLKLLQDGRTVVVLSDFLIVIAHTIATLCLLRLCIGSVRGEQASRSLSIEDDEAPQVKMRVEFERPTERTRYVPRLTKQNPLHWRERHFRERRVTFDAVLFRGCGLAAFGVFAIPIVIVIFSSLQERILNGYDTTTSLESFLPIMNFLLVCVVIPIVGIFSVSGIIRERQNQTLTSLLILPIDRQEILKVKLWSAGRHLIVWLLAGLLLWTACVAFGIVSIPVFALGISTILVFGFFAPVVGLWLSVRCQSIVQASLACLTVFLILYHLPTIFMLFLNFALSSRGNGSPEWIVGIGPLYNSLSVMLRKPSDVGMFDYRGIVLAAKLTIVAINVLVLGLTYWMWRNMIQRLENEPG